MNVLVACEESQRVCTAFREKGHNAFSCDLLPCSGGHPEWHIQDDVIPLLNGDCGFFVCSGAYHFIDGKWDLIIAHPPCTYLTVAGACNIPTHPERIAFGFEAATFFNKMLNADCSKIVVENPIPMKLFGLPSYSQLVRAYQFGENHNKPFCFWLKGVPPLVVDEMAKKPKAEVVWFHKKTGIRKSCSAWYNTDTANHRLHRSKTPIALARLMADQWG